MNINFINELKQKARKKEAEKEKEQLTTELKRRSSESAPKRFQKSKSQKPSKNSTPRRRNTKSNRTVPKPQPVSRPISLSTAPICPYTTLKDIVQVSAVHILPGDDCMTFLPTMEGDTVSFTVKGVRYEAPAIRAVMQEGKLKLLLYSSVTEDKEDALKPPTPSDSFVTVSF